MIGDIVLALIIFYWVLPLAAAGVLWLFVGVLELFFPRPKRGRT